MRQMIKKFFWIALLACSGQVAWGFALLGPVANGTEDAYQVTEIGYNPLQNGGAPPYFIDGLMVGPKNLSEGYRHNTPVMYYAFDESFSGYFGANGEAAVDQAFAILNNLTNVSAYSSDLTEFPLNSESVNYQAQALGLLDLKSATLSLLLEQLGLADAVRYTWALHDRYQLPNTTCPVGLEYEVIQRNFDFIASPLDQLQYSAYINGELYSYYIPVDLCGQIPSPPDADAIEIPVDPLANNPPVASGNGEDGLFIGYFYTGLTRDDVGGLRYLISSNNFFNPSLNYSEVPAAGSALLSTNLSAPILLTTSNLNQLVSSALTTDPATMQTLFPGLELASTNYYFTNVPVITAYLTNFLKGDAGAPPTLFVGVTTNVEQIYQYTFANVVTNSFNTSTIVTNETIQTVQTGGGFILQTNYSRITTNLLTGDYFIIPAGGCPPDIFQTLQANVITATNTLISTNIVGTNGVTYFYSQSLIYHYTNHVFEVAPCTLETNAAGLYQGVEKIQFVHVADTNYDSILGQFIQPITNQYTMVVITNGQAVTETFQRILTTPDFVFGAADLANGPAALPTSVSFDRTIPLFNNSRTPAGNAGPGTIDPGSTITFNKVGPIFLNESPSFLSQEAQAGSIGFIWGSFDGTTNAPIVYPNGTSITNLEKEALIQVLPATLPNGTDDVVYNVTLSATGDGISPYLWSLASGSAGLPAGLSLSPGGMISGTPTQTGIFYFTILLNDSSVPPLSMQINYSITIN
jgi:hypothetical protein